MISETIYDHFKRLGQTNIQSLIEPPVTFDATNNVSKVINILTQTDAYDAFCVEGDLVFSTNIRKLLGGKDIEYMKIKPFLYQIRPLTRSDTIQKAADIINNYRIRSVPVVEKNQIIGAINAKNILKQMNNQDNKWITANLIYTQNPITITSKESLSTARKIMRTKRIDHLPVIHKGTISQVLTSFHLLQAINPQENLGRRSIGMEKIRNLESNIGNIGSTRIPQCSPKDNLNTILGMMLDTNTTCCLVTLWDKLHGIITYRDIISLLAVRMESEIPLYIVGMPADERNVDLITSKLTKSLKRLQNVYSEIQEARVTIKQQRSQGQRKLYEVSARVTTPYKTFGHKEVGWDLSQVCDTIGQRLLRQLSKRAKRRFKTSIRKIETPGLIEPI
jgi:CBS domain-containing protein